MRFRSAVSNVRNVTNVIEVEDVDENCGSPTALTGADRTRAVNAHGEHLICDGVRPFQNEFLGTVPRGGLHYVENHLGSETSQVPTDFGEPGVVTDGQSCPAEPFHIKDDKTVSPARKVRKVAMEIPLR